MPRKGAKRKPEDSQWYYDDDLWLDLLRALDDDQAERLARLLHRLIEELKKPDGAFKVRCCLENGRRVAFSYTRFANECKLLFIESLDKPESPTLAEAVGRKSRRQAKRGRA